MITVGEFFKRKIDERMLIQNAVAAKAGIHPNKLSAVLNGRRKLDAVEFFNLCRALGVDPKEAMEATTEAS